MIKGYINELKLLKNEIKNTHTRLRSLKDKAKNVEQHICNYLKSKNEPGVRYDGVALVLDEKEGRSRKKKQDQLKDSLDVLRRYGIPNPQRALDELLESRRGDTQFNTKLTVKKYNKK